MVRHLFHLGRVMATPAAREALAEANVPACKLLARHLTGDWGDLGDGDRDANDASVRDGSRILSAYVLPTGERVWVLTEAAGDDGRRAATTILLPDEY